MNYFAFISYTGADRKWAAWLHRQLEYYRIPTGIFTDSGSHPKNLRPIFWYKKDLSGTVLADALRRELDASRYLIVICSPESARSAWVNDEVKRFCDTGRADRIIPFVVDGETHSADPTRECLPPALRELPRDREIRAISVADQGRRHALVDVVATMLGVRFDALWQRYKRRRTRLACVWSAVAALLVAVALFAWDYTRERTEYYSNSVDIYGIPQGIGRLTSEQVAHRFHSLRFTYRRTPFGEPGFYSWRLDRVEAVNSAGYTNGQTVDGIYQYPVLKLDYADGKLDRVTGKNIDGVTEMIYTIRDDFDGTPAGIVDLGGTEITQASGYLPGAVSDDAITTRSKIKRLHLIRDDRGRIIAKTFHSNNDDDLKASAIANEHDTFGERYTLSDEGLMLRADYLGLDGKPSPNRYGVASEVSRYNADYTVAHTGYLNIEGLPVLNENLFAGAYAFYDSWGNVTSIRYCDVDDKPIYNKWLYSIIAIDTDEKGNRTAIRYFSPDSVLTINEDGFAITEIDSNNQGRPIVTRYYDENATLAPAKNGAAIVKAKFDSKGRLTQLSYFDKDGKPIIEGTDGCHSHTRILDADGYLVEVRFFDEDMKPTLSTRLAHSTTYAYDPYHRITSVAFFDTEGRPTLNDQFYHRMDLTYDSRGNRIKEEFFDSEGQRILCDNGYAVHELGYDDAGNITFRRTFDTDYQPVFVNLAVTLRDQFNPKGLLVKRSWYDADDSLTTNQNWVAIEQYSYDEEGHNTLIRFFDKDSLPTLDKETLAASIVKTYDRSGNCIREEYFDTAGKPTLNANHTAVTVYEYDDKRNNIAQAFFGTEGEPVVCSLGYHGWKRILNSRGSDIDRTYYGTKGELVPDNFGVAHYHNTADELGRIVKEEYFAADGSPVEHGSYGAEASMIELDNRGRITKRMRLDSQGNIRNPSNLEYIAFDISEYDNRGNEIRKEYRDADGNLTKRLGYSSIEFERDALNRITSQTHFDADGKPASGPNFYARFTARYPHPDSIIYTFMDNQLRPVINMTHVMDSGNLRKMIYTDSVGNLTMYHNPTLGPRPFAMMINTFDAHRNKIATDFYGSDGKLLSDDNGHASEHMAYDERGRLIETRVLGAYGAPVSTIESGISHVLFKYDDFGNIVEQTWLDADDKPSDNPWGYWKIKNEYDQRGNRVKSWYTLPDGTVTNRRPSNGGPNGGLADESTRASLPEELRSLILCSVEGLGQMWDEGYRGMYVVLRFNDWVVGVNNIEDFSKTIRSAAGNPKHVILWRFDENNPEGGEIFDQTFSEAPLTARFMDLSCPDDTLPRLAAAKLAAHEH